MKHLDDTESLITVRDWLRFAVSRFNEAKLFFGHGSDNAFDEAAYLILPTLHPPLEQLAPWLENPEEVTRALDLCTGSGCLAILAALAFPHAEVDAVDLSKEALE